MQICNGNRWQKNKESGQNYERCSGCCTEKSQYLFTAPSGKNTWDTTFNDYFGEKYDSNAVLLQIFHTTDGKVVAINFGKDGYMVTIVPGKETTCVYNGKSLKSIEG